MSFKHPKKPAHTASTTQRTENGLIFWISLLQGQEIIFFQSCWRRETSLSPSQIGILVNAEAVSDQTGDLRPVMDWAPKGSPSASQHWRSVGGGSPKWQSLLGGFRASRIVRDRVGLNWSTAPRLTQRLVTFGMRNSCQQLKLAVDQHLSKRANLCVPTCPHASLCGVMQLLCLQGIKLHTYRESWLIWAATSTLRAQVVLQVLQHLSWMVNFKKAKLVPVQSFDSLGVQLNLHSCTTSVHHGLLATQSQHISQGSPQIAGNSDLHGPLTRCVKLRVTHALGMPGTFSLPPTLKETVS